MYLFSKSIISFFDLNGGTAVENTQAYDSTPDQQIKDNKNDKITQVNVESEEFPWWIVVAIAANFTCIIRTFDYNGYRKSK